ncbi:MAG: hypothetical protein RIB60_10315 [Phycisphaerales bacterium]
MTNTTTHRIARLERTNRRLALALVALGGVGIGAVLAGFAQPGEPETPEYVGLAIHEQTNFLYRLQADGTLERLSLGRGRVAGGGTPAIWNEFPVGRDPRSP